MASLQDVMKAAVEAYEAAMGGARVLPQIQAPHSSPRLTSSESSPQSALFTPDIHSPSGPFFDTNLPDNGQKIDCGQSTIEWNLDQMLHRIPVGVEASRLPVVDTFHMGDWRNHNWSLDLFPQDHCAFHSGSNISLQVTAIVPGQDLTLPLKRDDTGKKSTIQRRSPRPKVRRTHVCGDCGKVFLRRNALHSHQLTHSNERKYKCKLCASTFKRKHDFKRHGLTIHFQPN